MNKKVLIISPYFIPSNAAEMQRIRMSLGYFSRLGWDAEVVAVDDRHSEMVKDPLLSESIPSSVRIHRVQAFSRKWTARFGLGSLALRSLWFYRRYVDRLLSRDKFDLVFFSTTQFPVCILGSHWKKKFGVPYIIDMQDPWHSDYYQDKPKAQRPKKYWFSYRLNKYLEPLAMKDAGGIMSVSAAYIETLRQRYPVLKSRPATVITFGSFAPDLEIAGKHSASLPPIFEHKNGQIEVLYVGRGGHDMRKAILLLFTAFKKGLESGLPGFSRLRFHFAGTSYAPAGKGQPTIQPIAVELGIAGHVEEITDRVGFYRGLNALLKADALVVPGSDDPKYTASKLFPYLLAGKPLLAIFSPRSSSYEILAQCKAGSLADLSDEAKATGQITRFLTELAAGRIERPEADAAALEKFSALEMSKRIVDFFDLVTREHGQD